MKGDSRKVRLEICKRGRHCHCCKKKINKGESFVRAGDEPYSNICKQCIKSFAEVLKIL